MKVSWRFLSHVYKSLSCSDNITRIYCFEFVFSCLFFEENLYQYHLHKTKNERNKCNKKKLYFFISFDSIVSKGKQKFVDFIIMKNSKCIFKQIIIPRSGLVPKFPSERSTRIEDTTSSTVGLQSGQSDDIRTTIGFVQERRSRRVGAQRRCKIRIFVSCWTEER